MVVIGKLLPNVYLWQIPSKQYHFNDYDVIIKIGLGTSDYKNVVGLKKSPFCFLGSYNLYCLLSLSVNNMHFIIGKKKKYIGLTKAL